jgi:hypothetical protein
MYAKPLKTVTQDLLGFLYGLSKGRASIIIAATCALEDQATVAKGAGSRSGLL